MGGESPGKKAGPRAPLSWRDMFEAASEIRTYDRQTPGLYSSQSSPALSYAANSAPRPVVEKSRNLTEMQSRSHEKSGKADPNESSTRKASGRELGTPAEEGSEVLEALFPSGDADSKKTSLVNFQLAIYIAMAHAGLALVVLVLYSVAWLLQDFWKPIQWAVLCSMPLRQLQETLVEFWEQPLTEGILETLMASPIALYKAFVGTVADARENILGIVGKAQGQTKPVGFAKLFQWLISFAFFSLGLEFLGPATLSLVAFVGVLVYAAGTGLEVRTFSRVLSRNAIQSEGASEIDRKSRQIVSWIVAPVRRVFMIINKTFSRILVVRLHTIVALGLMSAMILGSLTGISIFSYKVGVEGKDAMVKLKEHVEESNYAEIVGINKWLEENKIPDLVDTYMVKAYETLMEQLDVFAANNNITEVVTVGKEFVRGVIEGTDKRNRTLATASRHPLLGKLQGVHAKIKAYDFNGIYADMEWTLEHFHIKQEDLLEKIKSMRQSFLDVGKQLFASGTSVMTSGTAMLIFVWNSIASGAVGLFNFVTQSIVFLSVLYYLMTSKSGGVMEQILGMVPLSESTRSRCATVLDNAVSSVLLAAVKTACFQAAFTWLLFRVFNIHFLYMCTVLVFIQSLLPMFPNWIASIPAGVELAFEKHYLVAIILMLVHVGVMDYGVEAIHREIPGHNAYLTGLSIAGGMALFTPALEGAIMGPLLMTVLIASKNLYQQFILKKVYI